MQSGPIPTAVYLAATQLQWNAMTALQENIRPMWPKLQLKYGPNKNLVAPHALARSAIFSTQYFRSNVNRPRYFSATSLETMGAIKVYQTAGHRLDQGDADVFYELLRRVFDAGCDANRESRVCFNRGEFLNALRRVPGGATRKLLDASLDRLSQAEFDFRIPKLFAGKSRLILKMHRREHESAMEYDYDVLLDVELARLFGQGQWALLRRSHRDKLKNNSLAKGLHAYYSTHAIPYPVLATTVQNLMGRESMQWSKWLVVLAEALIILREATGWNRCVLGQVRDRKSCKVTVEKNEPTKASKGKVPAPVDSAPSDDPFDDI